MKLILFLLILSIAVGQYITLSQYQQCGCPQLSSQTDCLRLSTCIWNYRSLRCEVRLRQVASGTTKAPTTTHYCNKYQKEECRLRAECAWEVTACQPFSSCVAFAFETNELCSAVNASCITDGKRCVQLGDCSSYTTSISCKMNTKKNTENNLCYWNPTDIKCADASICSHLPKYFKSDHECRSKIPECTADPKGGCSLSGLKCSDQYHSIQCFWDRRQTTQCSWNGNACFDKTCESAPISKNNDALCKAYLPVCTSKKSGGCTPRKLCSDSDHRESCVTNKDGGLCFWDASLDRCVDRSCINAPFTFFTNEECLQFSSTCIANYGGGCKEYKTCIDASSDTLCSDVNLLFQSNCYWDSYSKTCRPKSCQTAPANLKTYQECSAFLPTCTLASTGSGCAERTCDLAPTFMTTTYQCETYLSGCITKLAGGCRTNSTCEAIDVESACVKDSTGKLCFWYNNKCMLKTCANAPTSYNTHQLCQTFLKECSVKKDRSGCTEMVCTLFENQSDCKFNKDNGRCHWVGLCYTKKCSNAPKTSDFDTDLKCRNYLPECTVDHSGKGCTERPVQCREMTRAEQCVTNAYGRNCGWVIGTCYDRACFTAPLTADYDTYEECNTYLVGCTTRSDGIGGCQVLAACSTYTSARSCRFNASGGICEFRNGVCADKSCTTAPQTSDYDSNTKCDTYLTGCIVAPSGLGCVAKPAACSGMTTSTQCTSVSTNASGGPCAWVGSSCVDRQCTSAPASNSYDTHQECNQFLNTCTVLATGVGGCESLKVSCNLYSSMRQCEQLMNGNFCSWYNNSCTDRACYLAPDSLYYDEHSECTSYLSTCTVVRRIATLGCTVRNTGCQNLSELQCVYEAGGNQCYWDTTAATPYCRIRYCSPTIGVSSFTTANCNAWKAGCVANNSANGCQDKYSWCTWYGTADNCIVDSSNALCYWNGSSCSYRTCATTSGITDFNHINCFAWMKSCTVGQPTSCFDKPATCASANNYDQCYYDITGKRCAWVGTACVDRTCTNHGYAVTVFNNVNCNAWMAGCSATLSGTGCEITRTCSNHGLSVFNHTNCQTWLSSCTVSSDGSSCRDKTCTNHGVLVTEFTPTNCSAWLPTCTSNPKRTACVSTKTCSGGGVAVPNHTNCSAWMEECTVSGNSCVSRTCFNHGTNILIFNHANCNEWLSSCTVSEDGLSCQPKTCYNYGAQVIVYNQSNCKGWLEFCTVNQNGTGCETTRNCSQTSLTSFQHADCEGWSIECKYWNNAWCVDKTCSNYSGYISEYSHNTCQAWLRTCTLGTSGTGCQEKSCWNYGINIQIFTHASCASWSNNCTVNTTNDGCELRTCTNYGTNISTFNNDNCRAWLSYCVVNAAGNACELDTTRSCSLAKPSFWTHLYCEQYFYNCTVSGSTCVNKSCTNFGNNVPQYDHFYCSRWLSSCTVNVSLNNCEARTCKNYRDSLTSLDHAGCNAWLSSCTINRYGAECEEKTCENHNLVTINQVTCAQWLPSCEFNGSNCSSLRTCSNHGLTTINFANCSGWLYTCTNNSSISCIPRTCTNHSSNVTYFNHENCEGWLADCTANSAGTACIDKTCNNYEDKLTTFTATTCAKWLSTCTVNSTNDGCVSTKTCGNHGSKVTVFTHANCAAWMSSCTVDSQLQSCVARTCTNHGSNVSPINHANCQSYLSTCTNNGGSTACEEKNCTNHGSNVTVFNAINCYNWFPFCTVNNAGNGCISIKTCTNYGTWVTTFDHKNCNAWLNTCTANTAGTACEAISCSNAPISVLLTFTDSKCASWLSSCTANNNNSGCETKTCAKAPSSIGTKNSTNCANWYYLCTGNGTDCINKTCANYSGGISASNCNNWLSTCSAYSPWSNCETIRTCANYAWGGPNHTNCTNWLATCTVNNSNNGCTDRICSDTNGQLSWYYHSDCNWWSTSCTNNSFGNGSACQDRTCTNYRSNISPTSHSNCSGWKSTCTVNASYNNCEQRHCSNYKTALTVFNDANCQAWWPACVLNSTRDGCTADCTNYGSAITTFNHANCQNWDPMCTVKSGNTACERKTCSNHGSNVVTFNHTNCSNWLGTCTNSGSSCIQRTCYNYSGYVGTFDHANCNSWFYDCTGNKDATGCTMKTCSNHGSNVTVFTDANCSGWLSYCVANWSGTGCTTTRTCYNHFLSVFNHYNCQQWLSTCTVNGAANGCEEISCSNSGSQLPSFSHANCTNWFEQCTNNGSSGCLPRSCSNYGGNIPSVNDTNCANWLFFCEANNNNSSCKLKTCQARSSPSSANCKSWLPYCEINDVGNKCYTMRTCSNYGINIKIFNHTNCQRWLSICTVNAAGTGCEPKTCYNHKSEVTTFTNANCVAWHETCATNSNNTGCQTRTCYNHGTNVVSAPWGNHAECYVWLDECLASSYSCYRQSSLECKTTDYTTQLQRFDPATCIAWSSTCVPNQAQTSCQERTCTNHGSIMTVFNHVACDNWLSPCTVNVAGTACEARSCSNHGSNVTVFNNSNCSNWLSTCTVNGTNNGCTPKTCYNYGANIGSFSYSNCNNWLNSCTNVGSQGCQPKNCDNYSNYSSSFSHNNCYNWSPLCTVNSDGTACISVRTCSNHKITLFSHTTCSDWLYTCTVNAATNACEPRTCENYGSNVTVFNHFNCQQWMASCTVNQAGTRCEARTCTNHGSNVVSFNTTNCQNWLWYCKLSPLGGACEPKTCDNHSISTFNHTNCSNWLRYCTVSNDGRSCTTLRTCSNHGAQVTFFNHANCQAWSSQCTNDPTETSCVQKTCSNHQSLVTSFTHTNCQNWMFACTANGGVCQLKSCTNHGSNVVTFTHNNCSNWLSTCTVNATNNACTLKTCTNTTGIPSWTHQNCEAWLSTCQLNKATTCTNLQSNCGDANVSYHQCTVDLAGDNCVWFNGACIDRSCSNYDGGVYTHSHCESWLSSCTVDSNPVHTSCVTKPALCTSPGVVQDQCVKSLGGTNCVWFSGACQNRSCTNFTGAFTHANCESWLSSCTTDSNAVHAACISKSANCVSYTHQDQCVTSSSGTVCFWTGSSCVDRNCDQATQDLNYNTDAACKSFLSSCTVARRGECMTRLPNCSDYKQQSQCFKNLANGSCYWNAVAQVCSDITCLNAPSTMSDYTACNAFLNTCTVNAAGNGCITRIHCVNYTTQRQCVKSITGEDCAWTGGLCYVKSCLTAAADSSRDTHEECQNYLPNCTVVATGLGGCMPLASCNSYTAERQCVVNASNQVCGWNGTRCDDKSCATAPPTYSFDSSCASYLPECTVNSSGSGCMKRLDSCDQYTVERNCVKTLLNVLCYWNPTTSKCEIRSCSNVPSTARTWQQCVDHYFYCYTDQVLCRDELCEDLQYKSDEECKQLNPKCTSDGQKCISRKKCEEATNEIGCTFDINGIQCAWWITPGNQKCVTRTCYTAPKFLRTEEGCQDYYPVGNCTTTAAGGCVPKATCEQANTQAACTTSSTNHRCVWDGVYCRDEACEDFRGSTDSECTKKYSNCLSDGQRCISPVLCSSYRHASLCRKGVDGVCIWFQDSCIAFKDCSSLPGRTDQICKTASSKCTSDGNNCIALSNCSSYKIKSACVTGTDGICVWSKNACRRFLTCYDLPYLTHAECQAVSRGCTTDRVVGCIPLQNCTAYSNEEQCKISTPLKIKANEVLITGVCVWSQNEQFTFSCRDQACSDLKGTSHEQCALQLRGCTSNGSSCIAQSSCVSYTTNLTCVTALGTEGKCVFDNGCRGIRCSDIPLGKDHEICSSELAGCISDGTNCIETDICINYTSKQACQYGGVDGVCVWNGNQCSLMTSCQDASLDEVACSKYPAKCTYQSNECKPHTCATKGKWGACDYIEAFDGLEVTVCAKNSDNNCVEARPETLPAAQCFQNSFRLFYWNTSKNACLPCTASRDSVPIGIGVSRTSTQNLEVEQTNVILGLLIQLGCIMI